MSRIDDWIQLIDDPDREFEASHPADEAIAALMVQLAFADGVVQDDELAFFARVRPGPDVARWVEACAVRPVDLSGLAPIVTTPAERRSLLALAARVVGLDGVVATEEIVHLHRIVDHLGLPKEAIRDALADIVGRGGPVDESYVRRVTETMDWRDLVALEVVGDALAVLGRVKGGDAVVVVNREGVWARFDEGEALVRFEEIVGYTRLPVRGRAFHVRTDGADHSFAEPVFRVLGTFLDRLYVP